MKCPSCNETLLMSDKNGIEIDYCPECRGIWLDRGELDKIIERSTSHYSNKDNYGRDQDRYEQPGQGHPAKPYQKKKDSFLGDLFDF
jgi:uncharacterized protein